MFVKCNGEKACFCDVESELLLLKSGKDAIITYQYTHYIVDAIITHQYTHNILTNTRIKNAG